MHSRQARAVAAGASPDATTGASPNENANSTNENGNLISTNENANLTHEDREVVEVLAVFLGGIEIVWPAKFLVLMRGEWLIADIAWNTSASRAEQALQPWPRGDDNVAVPVWRLSVSEVENNEFEDDEDGELELEMIGDDFHFQMNMTAGRCFALLRDIGREDAIGGLREHVYEHFFNVADP